MLKSNHLHILPECYIDERLCQLLLKINKVNHKKGVGAVAREFRDTKGNNGKYCGKFCDKPALALIDRDKIKGKSDFFRDGKNFIEIEKLKSVSLVQHKNQESHYVIIVEPIMEKFLLDIAKEGKITKDDFSFLEDIKSFTSESKAREIYYNAEFKRFVNKLIEHEVEPIIKMKDWLEQFYKNLKIEI